MPKSNRPIFALECTVCKARNYSTTKNPKNTTDRLELRKFCKNEMAVTTHKESK